MNEALYRNVRYVKQKNVRNLSNCILAKDFVSPVATGVLKMAASLTFEFLFLSILVLCGLMCFYYNNTKDHFCYLMKYVSKHKLLLLNVEQV